MSAVPISGTEELASRTPCIVWHTRSNTFVLIPQLELTRAVAQTVPDFFLILPFAGGLHQCRGKVSLYCPHVLGGRGVTYNTGGGWIVGAGSACPCIYEQFLTFEL